MMAHTTISDDVIWMKNIHGDTALADTIRVLEPGRTLRLKVDGMAGAWCKMSVGKDGRPTWGVRPVGAAHTHWQRLLKERRGDIVALELAGSTDEPLPISPPLAATEAERRAAVEAFLAAGNQGWRSTGPYGQRDELYDR